MPTADDVGDVGPVLPALSDPDGQRPAHPPAQAELRTERELDEVVGLGVGRIAPAEVRGAEGEMHLVIYPGGEPRYEARAEQHPVQLLRSHRLSYEVGVPLTQEDVLFICGRYEGEKPNFDQIASSVHSVLANVVENLAIKHMIAHRAKGRSSLHRKLWLNRDRFSVADFAESLSPPMKDLAATRVLLYLPDDVDPVVAAIEGHFRTCGHDCERKDMRSQEKYSAVHLQVTCNGTAFDMSGLNPATIFEVQVCTLSAHVWNELEHDIIYKQESGKPDAAQDELLVALHGVLSLASKTANRLMRHTGRLISENKAPILDPDGLQYSLRLRVGRPLTGDFKALFELLSALIDPLTNFGLHRCFEGGHSEQRAVELLAVHDPDGSHADAGCILLQFLPNLSTTGIEAFAAAHANPPSLLKFVRRVAPAILGEGKQS